MQLTPIKTKRFGLNFLIKNSNVEVKIFPALLTFQQLDSKETVSFAIDIKGPVKKFLIEYPLDKEYIRVSMATSEGFLAYRLQAENQQITFFLEKSFNKKVPLNQQIIEEKEKIKILSCSTKICRNQSMLFLGSMKKKDSASVLEEGDLKTILPWFFYLAQSVPDVNHQLIIDKDYQDKFLDKRNCKCALELLFKSVFEGFFCPRSEDFSYQGVKYLFNKDESNQKKLIVFKELLLNIFISILDQKIIFLPSLPKMFHQGEVINLPISDAILSFSWSCGKLQRVKIHSFKIQTMHLVFPKEIKNFKILNGENINIKNHETYLSLEKDKVIILEKFLK